MVMFFSVLFLMLFLYLFFVFFFRVLLLPLGLLPFWLPVCLLVFVTLAFGLVVKCFHAKIDFLDLS